MALQASESAQRSDTLSPGGEVLDLLGDFRGPCPNCGRPDARHELADAIVTRWHQGETMGDLAYVSGYEFQPELSIADVARLVTEWPRGNA